MSQKRDWNKVMKWVTPIMAALGLTFGTVAYIVADYHATEWAVEKLEDDKSRIYLAVKDIVTSGTDSVSGEIIDGLLSSAAKYNKIYNSLSGFKGLNDDALTEYLKETFNFADSIKKMIPELMENHEWVSQQRDGHTASEYITCGIVLAKDGVPTYFKDCDGTKRVIKHGRPSGINLNSGKKVYYYRDKHDKAILISYLSNY